MPSEVLAFPYLPISNRVSTNAWELLPLSTVDARDVVYPWIADMLPRLFELYRRSGDDWTGLGCVAKLGTNLIGEPVDNADSQQMHRAIVASLLEGNPQGSTESQQGWAVATSDNAILYIHNLGPDGHIAVRYGAMVQTLVGGLQVGTDFSEIRPPLELHVPFMHQPLDELYAVSIWEELSKNTDGARRLGRAIDWLDLAWRNTVSIDQDTRILALRAGFEVLLAAGDQTSDIREALSGLLDPIDVQKVTRTWTAMSGKPASAEMSDLEWWFQRFSFLRNKLMHGDQPTDDDYLHDGESHLWLGEAWLRRAIKRTVANQGHPAVLQTPFERAISDAADELGLDRGQPDDGAI